MRDAAGERSEAVFYRLNETGSGSYDLCIEADAAWLHAPERIRPVTIDLRAEPGGFEKTLLCCRNTAGGFDGIAAGFISYTVIKLCTGKIKDISIVTAILTVVFLFTFLFTH